jgi:hypothetical protein
MRGIKCSFTTYGGPLNLRSHTRARAVGSRRFTDERGVVLYYAIPLVRRRPSPGSCILGYQIVPDHEGTISVGIAVLRTFLGFIAVCLAPFTARDQSKAKFWLDKLFGTRAVRLN